MIDFVTFFTGDNLSYLKLFPLPFSTLDYLVFFFSDHCCLPSHHLLGVGTPMVQFDFFFFFFSYSFTEKLYSVPQLCPLGTPVHCIFNYYLSYSRLISVNAHWTL